MAAWNGDPFAKTECVQQLKKGDTLTLRFDEGVIDEKRSSMRSRWYQRAIAFFDWL